MKIVPPALLSLWRLHPVSAASGLGSPLSGVVQGVQSEGVPGRHRQILPATSEFEHAHSAAIRSEPDRRQREHGPPLLCFTFKLPCGETAAGYWWAPAASAPPNQRFAGVRFISPLTFPTWLCVQVCVRQTTWTRRATLQWCWLHWRLQTAPTIWRWRSSC